MANQHKSALDYVVEELQDELNRAGIIVDSRERMITYKDLSIGIPQGTTQIECRRKLKKLIKVATQTSITQLI